jgi:serine/threonine protein kinase
MPIVHRDVKLENIFISKNKQNPENSIIKLGDFGFA